MKLSSTQKLTLGAMTVALTVLALYATYAVPYVKIACLFCASVFVYALLCEGLFGYAILAFLASAAISFLIIPEKMYWALYVGLLGHYGIFKTFIDSRALNVVMRAALKLLYCNVFAMAGIVILKFVLFIDMPNEIYVGDTALPIWIAIIAAEVVFLIFDWVYSLTARIYEERIRPAILPRR